MILLLASAFAQQCDSVYSNDEFRTAISETDRLMGKAELDRAIDVLRKTENRLPCLEELVDRSTLASFARHFAVISFLQQDAEQAVRWGHAFLAISDDDDWGDLPTDHPLLNILKMEALEPAEEPNADAGFAHEKKGAVFMNGSFAPQPIAQEGMPYLVQEFQGRGYFVSAYWQDGDVFRAGLVDTSGPSAMPSFYDATTGIITPKGKPPPVPGTKTKKKFPLVPVIAAAGLVVGAGVLYSLAGAAEGKLKCNPSDGGTDCPKTSEELTALRSRANIFTMGAGVALAAGVGIGVTGVLVADDTPTLSIKGRF